MAKFRPTQLLRNKNDLRMSLTWHRTLSYRLSAKNRCETLFEAFLFKTGINSGMIESTRHFFGMIKYIRKAWLAHHQSLERRKHTLQKEAWDQSVESLFSYYTKQYRGKELPPIALEITSVPDAIKKRLITLYMLR